MTTKKLRRTLMTVLTVVMLWAVCAIPTYAARYVQILRTPVNVRADAGQSYAKVGETAEGKTYPYLATKKAANGKVWYQIQFTASKKGWVVSGYTKLIEKTEPATSQETGQSTAKLVQILRTPVNVRADAGQSYAKVGETTEGKTYPYLASKKAANGKVWYQIQFTASKKGWVVSGYTKLIDAPKETASTTAATTVSTTAATTASTDVSTTASTTASTASTTTSTTAATTVSTKTTAAAQKKVLITAKPVNVRADAGQSYAKVGEAVKGKTYLYLGSKKAANGKVWYQIQFTASKKGWICSAYGKLTDGAQTVQTTASQTKPTQSGTPPRYIKRTITVSKKSANVYSAPGTKNKKMGTVSRGAKYVATDWRNDGSDTTWYSFTRNGKTVWISRHNVTVSDSYTPIPEKNFKNGGTPMIYLSPSKQPHNAYAAGSTNEQTQMYRVAKELKSILEKEYVCTVYTAPTTLELDPDGRAYDAWKRGADVYLAIHSNADSKVNRNHYGPMAFYFPGSTQSKQLAQNVVAEMSKIAPHKSTVSPNVINGMLAFDKTGYSDVREPSNYGIASILAEVEFHDKADSARWIINHPKNIARALANALEKTFGLQKK